MEMVATNSITKPNVYGNKDSIKYVTAMCLLFAVLIIGRAAYNSVFYAFAAISLAIFVFSSVSHCFSFLLFLLPFSSILKKNVDGMSFFTILFFVVVIKMLIKKRAFKATMLLAVTIFAIYCFLFSGLGQITTIITISAGLIMLYCLRDVDVNPQIAVTSFALGIIGASSIALLRDSFPIINTFITDSMLKLDSESYALRFAGLHGNPNYYTLDITILLSAIIVMMYYKKTSKFLATLFIVLSVFGLMSVSKSFLLSLGVLIGLWFLVSMSQGVGKFIKFLMVVIVGIIAIYFFAYDSINTYLVRFITGSEFSIESFTTGRTDIWEGYISVILEDIKILFFGNGLNTILDGKGAHNTYLESVYMLGIVGSCIFLLALKSSMGKIITKPIMWIPVLLLLFRMMAIGILTWDNLWLYLGLFVVLSHYDKQELCTKRGVG